jgi:membrane-associated phospholipid phosphatase
MLARLRPVSPRWLAALVAGFAGIFLIAVVAAAPLAAVWTVSPVADVDRAAWAWSTSRLGVDGLALMRLVSALHGTAGILVLTALGAAAWVRLGHPEAALRLLAAVPVGMLLNVLVKLAMQRARPEWGDVLALPHSASFPSGHVAETTVFYGALALESWVVRAPWRWRLGLVALAVAMVPAVALSRIALGMHFLSDCVAAVVEGLAWLAACFCCRPSRAAVAQGHG